MPTTLGDQLPATLMDLADLIVATDDPVERAKLREQHKDIAIRLQKLINETVPQMTQEYKDATAALKDANAALIDAKSDLSKVADAVTKVAKVISALAKLAAML